MNLTEPIHPPFGVTQPRQLIRWEDVNSQGGRLARTRGYLNLPAIPVIAGVWNGFSEMLFQINCSVPNNLSLMMTIPSTNPNAPQPVAIPLIGHTTVSQLSDSFVWCVRDSRGNRYQLNSAVGGTVNAIAYIGQCLYGPFITIECWTTPASYSTNGMNAVKIWTSVRGNQDYRWAQDFPLGSGPYLFNSFIQTSAVVGTTYTLPLTFNAKVNSY